MNDLGAGKKGSRTRQRRTGGALFAAVIAALFIAALLYLQFGGIDAFGQQDMPELSQPEHQYLGETTIDASQVQSGVVYIAGCDKDAMKARFAHNGETSIFTVVPDGCAREYPLTLGAGEYTIEVMRHIEGNNYTCVASQTVQLSESAATAAYTHQNVMCSYDTASMVQLAETVVGDAETDSARTERVMNWTRRKIAYDHEKAAAPPQPYIPNIVDTIETGKGICLDSSSAAAALLRSLGIPTQIVTGYVDDDPTYHAWNRIYLDGQWVDMDSAGTLTGKALKVTNTY